MHTKIKASCICLKYRETAEKTRKARITSSHITKMTTSTLEDAILEVEEKNETEAQSCLDRFWYSLNCSARFDRVIIFAFDFAFVSRPRARFISRRVPMKIRRTDWNKGSGETINRSIDQRSIGFGAGFVCVDTLSPKTFPFFFFSSPCTLR